MEQIASLESTECCGIRELNNIMECSTAREAVVDAAEEWYENGKDGAYIFFSTTNESRIGHAIAIYIEKYKLGVVHKTHPTRNPNSENMLTMWVWTVNKANFQAFWHKTRRYKKEYKEN